MDLNEGQSLYKLWHFRRESKNFHKVTQENYANDDNFFDTTKGALLPP